MKIIDCVQGTPEWKQARCGMVTASRIEDVMAQGRSKGSPSVTREKYKMQIALEIITGQYNDSQFKTPAMIWGTEQEPFARQAYENKFGVLVEKVGFVLHPFIDGCGCSPDGLVEGHGVHEIKCPESITHFETLTTSILPRGYRLQGQFQIACCESEWCDYSSFDPRFPENLRLFTMRIMRDDAEIKLIQDAILLFRYEVEELVVKLRKVA